MSAFLGSLGDLNTPAQIMALAQEAFTRTYVVRPSSGKGTPETVNAVAKAYTDMQWCVWGYCTLAPSTLEMVAKDPDFHGVVRKISPLSYPIGSKPPAGAAPPRSTQDILRRTGQAIPGGAPVGTFSPPVLDPVRLASAGYDPVELQKLLAAGAIVGPMPPGQPSTPSVPSGTDSSSDTDPIYDGRLRSWDEKLFGRRLTQNEQYAVAAGGGLLALGLVIALTRRK
jgi:hypothetical protein